MSEFVRDFCPKNYQNARIFTTFARKMPEFYMIIAQKIFSRFFFWGGHVSPVPPFPMSMYRVSQKK